MASEITALKYQSILFSVVDLLVTSDLVQRISGQSGNSSHSYAMTHLYVNEMSYWYILEIAI